MEKTWESMFRFCNSYIAVFNPKKLKIAPFSGASLNLFPIFTTHYLGPSPGTFGLKSAQGINVGRRLLHGLAANTRLHYLPEI